MNVLRIAELSGVSKSTVYRALNGEKIKDSTKKRILAVMKENNMADSLEGGFDIRQSVRLVAFVTDEADRSAAPRSEKAVKAGFMSGGFTVIDVPVESLSDNSAEAGKILDGVNFHCYIFLGGAAAEKCGGFIRRAAAKRPVILINAKIEGPNIYCISTDVGRVTEKAVEKLTGVYGHKKILYCIKSRASCFNALAHDFENAVRSRGLGYSGYSVANCASENELPTDIIEEALRRNPSVTAVFAQDDVTAICAVKAAERLGLRVPEDISVVGYQGGERSEAAQAGISCIDVKSEVVGDMALMLAMSVLNGKNVSRKLEVPCVFIERRTTAPAREAAAVVVIPNSVISA